MSWIRTMNLRERKTEGERERDKYDEREKSRNRGRERRWGRDSLGISVCDFTAYSFYEFGMWVHGGIAAKLSWKSHLWVLFTHLNAWIHKTGMQILDDQRRLSGSENIWNKKLKNLLFNKKIESFDVLMLRNDF